MEVHNVLCTQQVPFEVVISIIVLPLLANSLVWSMVGAITIPLADLVLLLVGNQTIRH
jgi:hypothetical protein